MGGGNIFISHLTNGHWTKPLLDTDWIVAGAQLQQVSTVYTLSYLKAVTKWKNF
jgi:hypothetical protein